MHIRALGVRQNVDVTEGPKVLKEPSVSLDFSLWASGFRKSREPSAGLFFISDDGCHHLMFCTQHRAAFPKPLGYSAPFALEK